MTDTTPEETSTKTRIYQDVDGVINAQMPYGWGRLQNGHARSEGYEYRMRWAPRMVEELEGLLELGAERVWATTWRDDAEHPRTGIVPLIGVKAGSRVLHPRTGVTTYPSIYWKWDAIEAEQTESPSRFVWFDDEVDPYLQEKALELGGFAPLINPKLGITPKLMDAARRYISGEDPLDLLAELQ